MTLFLASVRNEGEAALALAAGADVIDLKEPLRGALGAVTAATVRDCVDAVEHRGFVSATVGDVPLDAATLQQAALQQHALGVDYVKLGVFPGDGAEEAMRGLDRLARRVQLIFVLFADALPGFDAVAVASRIGARGVMLDTMTKDGGSLLEHLTEERLSAFVVHARSEGLLMGLAGSLRAEHVARLLAIEPDLLGFRGALCRRHDRGGTLDPEACSAIRALIPRTPRNVWKRPPAGADAPAVC